MYWGDPCLEANSITPFINEYVERKRLAKIGLTSSYDDLPYIKATIFNMISEKLEKIEEEELKKKTAKR